MVKTIEPTIFSCPVCKVELSQQYGTQIHPNDEKHGIMLYCGNGECAAQEVAGHANKVQDAYQVILDKFTKRK